MRIVRFSPLESAKLGTDPLYGILENSTITVLKGDPIYSGIVPTTVMVSESDVRLLAPVIPRSKVVCVGKNYADHAAEMGGEVFLQFVDTVDQRLGEAVKGFALGGQAQVAGFQVAMGDQLLVSLLQGGCNLICDGERLVQIHGPLERRAFDEFKDERAFLHTVDGGDVCVVQRGQHLGFAGEAGAEGGVVQKLVWQNLDRHLAAELCLWFGTPLPYRLSQWVL